MSNVASMSPSVKKTYEGMSYHFEEIIVPLIDGKRFTRLEWNNPEFWIQVVDNKLKIRKPGNLYHDLIVSVGDMNAEDWIILE